MRKLAIILLLASAAPAAIFLNSFNSGQLSKDLKIRQDLDKTSMGSETLQNILVRPQGMAFKRPGTEYIDRRNPDVNIPSIPGTPEVLGTYKFTYISEDGAIWGVPFTDGGVVTLDADDAVNVGGGIVGIPYNNAADDGTMRFVSGDVVSIKGTTYYDLSHTLTAGTTITQLQFADAYNAETFDATETVSKYINMPTGATQLIQDTSGNLYYGQLWNATYGYVTKILTDGTKVSSLSFLNPTDWPVYNTSDVVRGLAITPDNQYLYIFIGTNAVTPYGYVEKWDLITGDREWRTTAVLGVTSWPGYDMAIDADGNAYAILSNGQSVVKFASANGAATEIDLYNYDPTFIVGHFPYEIEIDNDAGKVVVAGNQYSLQIEGYLDHVFNMIIMDLDGSNQIPIAVGGTYDDGSFYRAPIIGRGHIAIHNGYIYIQTWALGVTPTIYKYDFSGNEIASAAASTYASGLHFDLWNNIVVVNVDWNTPTTDRFYFYDTSLNALGSVSPFVEMLRTWDASSGGSWIQGGAVFLGELGTAAVPVVPGAYYDFEGALAGTGLRLIPFEYSTDDAYVLEFGHRYISFLRTVP